MTKMNIDLMKYDQVEFYERITEVKTKKAGIKIGEFLVISGKRVSGYEYYMVYSLLTGKPFPKIKFASPEDALHFGEWIDSIYGDYLALQTEYPHLDLFQLCQWTVENGQKIADMIGKFEKVNQIVSYQHIIKEYENV